MTDDRIDRILINHLGVKQEQLTDDARFAEDLKADSLDMLELAMVFEDKFSISVPDEDLDGLRTVGQLRKYLAK